MKRLILALLLCTLAFTAHAATDAAKPKVRAITAFVRLDRSTYETQIADTMKVLNAARSEFASHGYETQTVRIVTQPFAQLVKGLSDEQAPVFLKALDDLSQKDGFAANVGPAMLHDADDPAAMHLQLVGQRPQHLAQGLFQIQRRSEDLADLVDRQQLQAGG